MDADHQNPELEQIDPSMQPDPKWDYHPNVPLVNSPTFSWPPNPVVIVKSIASNWIELTGRVVIVG